MDTRTLDETARSLLSGERGLLAMDENTSTCNRAARRGRYDAARDAPAAN